jgi:hypothetical protein
MPALFVFCFHPGRLLVLIISRQKHLSFFARDFQGAAPSVCELCGAEREYSPRCSRPQLATPPVHLVCGRLCGLSSSPLASPKCDQERTNFSLLIPWIDWTIGTYPRQIPLSHPPNLKFMMVPSQIYFQPRKTPPAYLLSIRRRRPCGRRHRFVATFVPKNVTRSKNPGAFVAITSVHLHWLLNIVPKSLWLTPSLELHIQGSRTGDSKWHQLIESSSSSSFERAEF